MSRIILTNNGFFESPLFPSRMLGVRCQRTLLPTKDTLNYNYTDLAVLGMTV